MYQNIKVIIADDHDVFRDGLKMLLQKAGGIEVIEEARNGVELVEKALQFNPDVILTDLVMPGKSGLEAIEELYGHGFKRIIAISTFESDQLIIEALQAGASGYIVKNAKKDEITEAIKEVYQYKKYYCKSTSKRLSGLIEELKLNHEARKQRDLFTEDEKVIIRMVCDEKSSEEIASLLFIGKRTVEGIRSRIVAKMNVKTLAGFAVYAIRNGIYIVFLFSHYYLFTFNCVSILFFCVSIRFIKYSCNCADISSVPISLSADDRICKRSGKGNYIH